MGMYYCKNCMNLQDEAYFPMQDSEICPDCHLEYEEEKREAMLEDIADGRKEEIWRRRPND